VTINLGFSYLRQSIGCGARDRVKSKKARRSEKQKKKVYFILSHKISEGWGEEAQRHSRLHHQKKFLCK
jgi:hypothetical protein